MFKYDEIVNDLKKATETISSLRKERDYLKDVILKLEKNQDEYNKKLKILNEENKVLRAKILEKNEKKEDQEIAKNSIIKLYTHIKNIQDFNKQYRLKDSFEELFQFIKIGKYFTVIVKLCQIFVDFCPKVDEKPGLEKKKKKSLTLKSFQNSPKSTKSNTDGFLQSSENNKLLIESTQLLETLDQQNSRISNISKKITELMVKSPYHRHTRSQVDLKVPVVHERSKHLKN